MYISVYMYISHPSFPPLHCSPDRAASAGVPLPPGPALRVRAAPGPNGPKPHHGASGRRLTCPDGPVSALPPGPNGPGESP